MNTPARRALPPSALLLTLVLAFLASCGKSGPDRPQRGPSGDVGPWPFAPASMRIYPLTQFDRDGAGELMILCHVELTDAWGDITKGTGQLVVQLFGPEESMTDGDLVQRLVWEIDLDDLEANDQMFDPVTRTYRVQLVDLPDWVGAFEASASEPSRSLTLRATLTLDDGRERRVLRDDYRFGS